MDYKKIGNFILEERKAKNLTQAKLAEKLFISEKTISKWENGNGIPDTESLPKICEILGISINELLSGERLSNADYKIKAEEKMLELRKLKEEHDKKMLFLETVIGVLSVIILLSLTFIAAYIEMAEWIKITMIVFAFVVSIAGFFIALRIEQVAGYYECSICGDKHVPTYLQVLFAPHFGRTRLMKCPNCKKISFQKKVIK